MIGTDKLFITTSKNERESKRETTILLTATKLLMLLSVRLIISYVTRFISARSFSVLNFQRTRSNRWVAPGAEVAVLSSDRYRPLGGRPRPAEGMAARAAAATITASSAPGALSGLRGTKAVGTAAGNTSRPGCEPCSTRSSSTPCGPAMLLTRGRTP